MHETLLPRPATVLPGSGALPLDERTTLGGDPTGVVSWFGGVLRAATGLPLPTAADPTIRFALDPDVPGPEGYQLRVTPDGALVRASDPAGAQHAAQTLRQLLGPAAFRTAPIRTSPWRLPAGDVADRPAFAWRGVLLDVARHFQPKTAVLRMLDLLAAHKLNVLHLHLTDDQGWRFPVAAHPRLTEVGGWRQRSPIGHRRAGRFDDVPHGGSYTTDDLREIVAHAARLGVTVVPEIDIPGHTQAAIAAYPHLGNTGQPLPVWDTWGISEHVLAPSEEVIAFLRDVFDELIAVFPSPVIGIGGDEVPTVEWSESLFAKQRAADLGLRGPADLHGWFIREVAAHLATRGRRACGWDEVAEVGPLPPDLVIASWRGEQAGVAASRAGHDVVMCPEQRLYLDHRQSDHPDEPVPVGHLSTVDSVYRYRVVPPGADPARVLGAQANIWTEYLDTPERVDYAAFPRLAAFAEVVWSDPADRDAPAFTDRLARHHLPRLDALGVAYRPLAGPHPWQTRPHHAGLPRS